MIEQSRIITEQEYQGLQKKLEIATKALKEIEGIKIVKASDFLMLIAHLYSSEALKEMEVIE